MGNKRIYELAKELKKSSKDVVEKAQQLGIDVKTIWVRLLAMMRRNCNKRSKPKHETTSCTTSKQKTSQSTAERST